MFDLRPATQVLAELVTGVHDDQLDAPTPCEATSLGDLLDHVDGLALAAAATRTPLPEGAAGSSADSSRLGPDWRTRIADRLERLGAAWQDEAAWDGSTVVGGQDLPAATAAAVGLDEVLVHGWDIAVASGQPFRCAPQLVDVALGFVEPTVAQSPDGIPGLFGPAVPVPDSATSLDRLLGLTGRDPAWGSGR